MFYLDKVFQLFQHKILVLINGELLTPYGKIIETDTKVISSCTNRDDGTMDYIESLLLPYNPSKPRDIILEEFNLR